MIPTPVLLTYLDFKPQLYSRAGFGAPDLAPSKTQDRVGRRSQVPCPARTVGNQSVVT